MLGEYRPFDPTPKKVNEFVNALESETYLASSIQPFTFLSPRSGDPATEYILPIKGGYMDIVRWKHFLPTPRLFVTGAAEWEFDPMAAIQRFENFLRSAFGDDEAMKLFLQEVVGLLLSGVTSLEKIIVLIGPPRSGKGTLFKIIQGLVGSWQYTPLDVSSFSESFGLASLIDKRVPAMPDARLGNRSDQAAVMEKLLSISGRDTVTVNRKFMPAWSGQLTVRIAMAENTLPNLRYDTGACGAPYHRPICPNLCRQRKH